MREHPVTIPAELVKELWCTVKNARDKAAQAKASEDRLNALLKRMKDAGMADWLPTLGEVIAAGPYERIEC